MELEVVGVLVFVDLDVSEAVLMFFEDFVGFAEELSGQ